jgi:hypothetical protein
LAIENVELHPQLGGQVALPAQELFGMFIPSVRTSLDDLVGVNLIVEESNAEGAPLPRVLQLARNRFQDLLPPDAVIDPLMT